MQVEVNCLFEVNDDRIGHASREVFPDDGEDKNRNTRCVKKAMADTVETVLKNHFKDDSGVNLTFVATDDIPDSKNLSIRVRKIGSVETPATQEDIKDALKRKS